MNNLEKQFSEVLSISKSSYSMDTMIIETIGLLDDRDKLQNKYAKRVRYWYGCHFPELGKIIKDNIQYVNTVKLMGKRTKSRKLDFSKILESEIEAKLKKAALKSKGAEASGLEITRIRELCDEFISLTESRAHLYDNLKSGMNNVAPNLTALVGELVGARMISCTGSLQNLAKLPASTIQILGTGKSKHATSKYGFIYYSPLVVQAQPKNKGKMARSLAAKAALAIRCDALGDGQNNTMGLASLAKLEARLRNLEEPKSKCETVDDQLMETAPNLTALVGESVCARLISHGGSLKNLAKLPASSIQILGAEKAMFRARKNKHDTPKYGFIYHSPLVCQAAPKYKGKIARSLAAKAALAIRIDALGDGQNVTMGLASLAKLEASLKNYEARDLAKSMSKVMVDEQIVVPLSPMDEDDRKKVIEAVDQERRYGIDAAVVRAIKSKQVLSHQQLVSECVEQCSKYFKPDIKMIKERIENLITREYLERDTKDPNMFNYLA